VWTAAGRPLNHHLHQEKQSKEQRDARMTAREENRLIREIQAGDHRAFERLLDQYEARVYRLALRYTGSVSDAEDVTQEIFLGVYRGLARFRGDSALGTWIYRVAMNHCLEFRRKRRYETLPYDEELMLASVDWRDDPLLSAGKRDVTERVEAAIQSLPPHHRDVIVLHELQGLTYQEVAATLNVPVGTVKSRLSNAFRKLRDLLGCYLQEGNAL
jgi:RNA polymerase sigma-70 factor, ECF subfamily